MKLIPKKLQGGSFLLMFADYVPYKGSLEQASTASSPKTSSTKASSEDKGKLTEKDLFSILKDVDGLPNEMYALSNNILQMYKQASLFGTDGIGVSTISSLYAKNMMLVKQANFNKKEYDKAYNQVEKNGGLNEFAIDSSGFMYVLNEDKELSQISMYEYLDNKDKYTPLTNNNLLYYRAHDPSLVNNNMLFTVIDNGIGMKEVINLIKSNLTHLGSTTTDLQGYVKKAQGKVIEGFEELQKLANSNGKAAMDGIYKVHTIQKSSKEQADAALEWLLSSLTPNARNLLIVKGGDSEDPLRGAKNLLSKKVMSMMTGSFSYDETYQYNFDETGKRIEKDGKSKKEGEGSSAEGIKPNQTMRYMNGEGYKETVNILPGGNVGGLVTSVTGIITGSDDKPFEGKYLNELATSSLGTILDLKNATMGGNKIVAPEQVELIGNNKVHSVYWPTLSDGVTPDLTETTVEAMKQVNEELVNNKIQPNSAEAAAIYEKYGVPNPSSIRRFSIIDARTNNNALGVDSFDSTPLLETVSDREFSQYVSNYEQYYSKNGKKVKMDIDEFQWWNPFDWFGNYDDVYKGTVWIPHQDSYSNAMAGTGMDNVYASTLQQLDRDEYNTQRDFDARMTYVNPKLYE